MSPPPRSHLEDYGAGPLSLSISLRLLPALSLRRSASVLGSCSPGKAWMPQGHVPNLFTSTALEQKFINMNEGRVELGSVQLCRPASLAGPPCLQEGEPVLSPAKPGLSILHAPSAQRLGTALHLEAPSIRPLPWVRAHPRRGYYGGIAGTRLHVAASARNFIIRTHNTTQSLTCFIPLPFPNCISVKAPEVISLA